MTPRFTRLQKILSVPLNPVGWKAPTGFARRGGGRMGVGMAPNVEMLSYQHALREQLGSLWAGESIEEECRIDLYFSRQLITYASATGRSVTKHRQDLTNLRKSTEDALQPQVVKNDVLVVEGWTQIIEQSKTATPYVRIEVYR